MTFRVLPMLLAILLQAGVGSVCSGTAAAAPAQAGCTHGCCVGIDDAACGCVANPGSSEKAPATSAPVPAPGRDLVPQPFWVAAGSTIHPIPTEVASASSGTWHGCFSRMHQGHVPLTVLHCAFLH